MYAGTDMLMIRLVSLSQLRQGRGAIREEDRQIPVLAIMMSIFHGPKRQVTRMEALIPPSNQPFGIVTNLFTM
jgi:hypothetical protein